MLCSEITLKRNGWGTVFIVAGVVLFAFYLFYTNPFKVLGEVGRFDPWMFVAAVGVNYVGLVFLSSSWYILLRSLGFKTSLLDAVQISFVGLFVVWMLPFPSGFEIVRAYLVRDKEGGNLGKAVSSVIVSKVYYFISFGLMIALAAFIVRFVYGSSIPIRQEFIWFAVLFALTNTVTFAIILTPRIMLKINEMNPEWLKDRMQKMIYSTNFGFNSFNDFVYQIQDSLKTLRKKPLENVLSLLLVGFHWSTGAITAYMVAISLNEPINFWVIVLIYAVIEFIQQLNFIIPGGLGIVDAGLAGALVVVGVPLEVAGAISLLTRLATYWFELVLCGFVSFQFGYRETLRKYLG
ncbi:flippase-like domain-containing protein [Candidatus Bathyarchaeota archaeon]|nr:flippase-like domain-containing protein [Candidatus Bathyarchaeota archaeon]